MGRKLSDVRRQRKSSREQRRARIARLYHSGMLVQDIAKTVKAHRDTVRGDLAALQGQWLESQKELYAQRQIRELQRLDDLEAANWDACQRFKDTPAVSRFLTELRRIVETRCRILGLFVKETGEPGDGGDAQAGPAELRKILAELTTAELEVLSGPYRRYREQLTRRFSGLN